MREMSDYSVTRRRGRYNLRQNPRSHNRRSFWSLRPWRRGQRSNIAGRLRRRCPGKVTLTSERRLDSPELVVPRPLPTTIRIEINECSLHFHHVGYLEIDGIAHVAGRLLEIRAGDSDEGALVLDSGDEPDLGNPIERGVRVVEHVRSYPLGLLQYDNRNPSHVIVNNLAKPGVGTNMDIYGILRSSPSGDKGSINLLYLGFQQDHRQRFWLGNSPGSNDVVFSEIKGPFSADHVMAKSNFRWLLRNVEHTGSSLVFQLEMETVGKLLVPSQADKSLTLASPTAPGAQDNSFFAVPHF